MIEIRKCQKDDWEDIVKLMAQQGRPFPDLRNMLSASVVVKDGKVIAFGYISKYVEATFVPDLSSRKDIVSSLKLLSEQLVKSAQELDIDFIHVFSENAGFTEILKEHFGYKDCPGDAINLEVPSDVK